MELSSYEKQFRWRQATIKKAEKLRIKKEQEALTNFTPTIFTTRPQESVQKDNHFQKSEGSPNVIMRSIHGKSQLPTYQNSNNYPSSTIELNQAQKVTDEPSVDLNLTVHRQENIFPTDYHSGSSDSESDEPIVELLERERKQWQVERSKLIQCIHLQQLELAQRGLAAQERALDVAKDFAKVIELFEERLISIESNVQRELSSIKGIAESLLIATGKANNSNQSTDQKPT